MAWKQINGRRYYYRSTREGGRVKSEYYGSGEVAELVAAMDAIGHSRRETEWFDRKAERERSEREEREVSDWFGRIEDVADAAMRAAGFHNHKGQWRRHRHGGRDRTGPGRRDEATPGAGREGG